MSAKDTSVLFGRLATEADLAADAAVFHQNGDGEPYTLRQLPARAIWRDEDGTAVNVDIVQIELSANGAVICGAKTDEGEKMVCTIEELEFLDGVE